MQDLEQLQYHPFQKLKGKQVYKINENQYLRINKKGNGEVIAPARDPITKKLNWNNIIFTGGTLWGLVKVIFIVFLLMFLLWRYNIEVSDCIEMRKNYNPNTGCIEQDYFKTRGVDNEQIRISLPTPAEGDDKTLS